MKLSNKYKNLKELFAKTHFDKKENGDQQILRTAIVAELDAISLYEQLSENTSNKKLKAVLLDVAKEEKTHVGEFQALLKEIDKEQEEELKKGEKEIKKI